MSEVAFTAGAIACLNHKEVTDDSIIWFAGNNRSHVAGGREQRLRKRISICKAMEYLVDYTEISELIGRRRR